MVPTSAALYFRKRKYWQNNSFFGNVLSGQLLGENDKVAWNEKKTKKTSAIPKTW